MSAVIWAEDGDGNTRVVVNLTNVAAFAAADNLSDQDTLEQWLRVPDAG